MKRYISHKTVEAAQIEDMRGVDPKTGEQLVMAGGSLLQLPPDIFARGYPRVGDYIVKYLPDGYMSWSPKDKFEDGYTLA